MKQLSFAIAPLALALSPLALAVDTERSTPEIVITADRFASAISDIPASVTVITRSDIEARQASSVADLLATAGGLNMTPNGGPLTATSVFLRGTTNKQTLVLIDGVRANSTTAGGFDFSTLSPADIERIELVRGPGAVQYGADAIGGVIQIFTRQQERTTLSLRAGSYNTQEANLNSFIGNAQNGLGVSLGWMDTDGFNASNFGSGDRDGGNRKTLAVNGHRTLGDTRVEFSAVGRKGQTEYDDGISQQDYASGSLRVIRKMSSTWEQSFSLGSLRDANDSRGLYGNSKFVSARQTASWLNNVLALGGRWIGGLDYNDEHYDSAGASGYNERLYNLGAFIQSQYQFGKLDTQVGLRHDHHESFGGKTTGSAAAGWQFSRDLHGYVKFGTAYRAPSGNDLYYPGLANFGGVFGCGPVPAIAVCYAGDRNLRPEQSRQREIGLSYQINPSNQVKLTAYRNDMTNLIAVDFNQSGFPVRNIDQARLRGVELESSGRLAHWTYRVSASNQFAEDGQGQALARRPHRLLGADLRYTGFGKVQIGGEILARSSAVDFGAIPGYAIGNLYADWKASQRLKLGVRVDNVTNKDYTVVNGYYTPGRSAYLTAIISL